MRVARREPEFSAPKWMGCPRVKATHSNEVDDYDNDSKGRLTASATIITSSAIPCILSVLTIRVLSFNFSL